MQVLPTVMVFLKKILHCFLYYAYCIYYYQLPVHIGPMFWIRIGFINYRYNKFILMTFILK